MTEIARSLAINRVPPLPTILTFVGLLLALWLPRWVQLDHYVTVDERHWLVRSANFTQALASGHYEHTFQQGHPGVTVMWLGTLGNWLSFPEYGDAAPGQLSYSSDEYDLFVEQQGFDPLRLLVAGRRVVVAANVLLLMLAWWLLRRLLRHVWIHEYWLSPDAVAIVATLLIGLHPFLVGHSRLLHPDSLLWTLMFVSVIGYLGFAAGQARQHVLLVISGIAAGLAWLTKTPGGYLVPFVGLVAVVYGVWGARAGMGDRKGSPLLGYVVWMAVAAATFFVLWPALWVDPLGTLDKMFQISQGYAAEGHDSAIFFGGQIINGDPGFWFYPVTFLWRASPVTLVGLGLLFVGLALAAFRRGSSRHTPAIQPLYIAVGALLLFSLGFWIFMNLGAKKFDRYLLPAYAPLIVVAALGFNAALGIVRKETSTYSEGYPNPVHRGILPIIVLIQAVLLISVLPTYLSYYNPLMGGSRAAPQSMFMGWGQGLAEAADFVNQQSAGSAPTVATWYGRGPLSYYLDGEFLSSHYYWQADYAVVYANQRQRQAPARQLMAHWNRSQPAFTATLNGVDYAQVYQTDQLTLPRFVADWNDQIRLISYTLNTGAIKPGQEIQLELYLLNLAPIDENLNMLVRIVNQNGVELLRSDRWPFGSATSDWNQGELWVDRFNATVPDNLAIDAQSGLYRVEVRFYEPATLTNLPVSEAASGEFIGETHILDYVEISGLPAEGMTETCAQNVKEAERPQFGEIVALSNAPVANSIQPGNSLEIELCWQSLQQSSQSYTVFAHLVGPDGQLAAQQDRPPLNGFLPMHLWYSGMTAADRIRIPLPEVLEQGQYRLLLGLYDPSSGERLPIHVDDQMAGDAYTVGLVDVK